MSSFIQTVKTHRIILIFLFLLSIVRIFWVNEGHLYWNDELRYLNAYSVIDHVSKGEISNGISFLFNAHGRPGYVLLSTIPTSFQLFLNRWNILSPKNPEFFIQLNSDHLVSAFDPHFFDLASFFNCIVLFAIGLLFYHILLILLENKAVAGLGTMIYCLLVNSNVYVRHLLPYDYSLLFFFLAILLVLKNEENPFRHRFIFFVSTLSVFTFLVYPGYLVLWGVVALALTSFTKERVRSLVMYIFSSIGILALVEGLSRVGGRSYLEQILNLSTRVTQGTFEEGFIFPLRYLFDVEGVMGVILVLFFFIFVLFFLSKQRIFVRVLFFFLIFTYISYASLGVFMKRFVFYGRIMHMYYPFLVLALIMTLSAIKRNVLRKTLWVVVLGISLLSFACFTDQYVRLKYPFDFTYRHNLAFEKLGISSVDEFKTFDSSEVSQSALIYVNAKPLHPIPNTIYAVDPPEDFVLINRTSHPLILPVYRYEGHAFADRQRLKEYRPIMRIYMRKILLRAIKGKGVV